MLPDRIPQAAESPGSAGKGAGGPAPLILAIEDCRSDLAAHIFVDGNGREVTLTRAESAPV
jgi:hypothetical protein